MTKFAPSLLPRNATALERRLAETNADVLDIPVEIDTLMDPERIPLRFLPGSPGTWASTPGAMNGPSR